MNKRSDVFSEIIVGIFMVAVLTLLAYFTIVISGVDLLMGKERVAVTVAFPDIGGLKERDNVVYRGMKVGTVERIALGEDSVTVRISINKDVTLREKSRITVASNSLLGGNFLQMDEGTGKVLPLAETVFRGERPLDWMRDLGEIARNLNSISNEGGLRAIVTNLEAASEKVNTIVARVERGEGTLGKLLGKDDVVYADISNTVVEARATFRNLSLVTDRLARGEGMIGRLLSADDTAYGDLTNTLARVSAVAERIAAGEGTLGQLLGKDDTVYRDLKLAVSNIREVTQNVSEGDGLFARLTSDNEIADNAAVLMKNLRDVSQKIAEGKSTLGKLTTDAEMYDELNALVKDLRQIIDNYRDTTPISSFAGLVGGAL